MSTSIKVVQFFNYPVHPAAALTKYFSEHVKMQKKPKKISHLCALTTQHLTVMDILRNKTMSHAKPIILSDCKAFTVSIKPLKL